MRNLLASTSHLVPPPSRLRIKPVHIPLFDIKISLDSSGLGFCGKLCIHEVLFTSRAQLKCKTCLTHVFVKSSSTDAKQTKAATAEPQAHGNRCLPSRREPIKALLSSTTNIESIISAPACLNYFQVAKCFEA